MRRASVAHLRQIALYIVRVRRRRVQTRVIVFVADDGADGANQTCLERRGFENIEEQCAGGRLAIRAGHADQRQRARRKIALRRAQPCKGFASVAHLHDWHARRLRGQLLTHDSRRAMFDGVADVFVTIRLYAAICHKHIARLHLARVHRDLVNGLRCKVNVDVLRDDAVGQRLYQLRERLCARLRFTHARHSLARELH